MPRRNQRNERFKKNNSPSTKFFDPDKLLKKLQKEYKENSFDNFNNNDAETTQKEDRN